LSLNSFSLLWEKFERGGNARDKSDSAIFGHASQKINNNIHRETS